MNRPTLDELKVRLMELFVDISDDMSISIDDELQQDIDDEIHKSSSIPLAVKYLQDMNAANNHNFDAVMDRIYDEVKKMQNETDDMLCELMFPDVWKAKHKVKPIKQKKAQQPAAAAQKAAAPVVQQKPPAQVLKSHDWVQLVSDAVNDQKIINQIKLGAESNIDDKNAPEIARLFVLCAANQPIGIKKPEMAPVRSAGFTGRTWKGYCAKRLMDQAIKDMLIKYFSDGPMMSGLGAFWPECDKKLAAEMEANTKRQVDQAKQAKEIKEATK